MMAVYSILVSLMVCKLYIQSLAGGFKTDPDPITRTPWGWHSIARTNVGR